MKSMEKIVINNVHELIDVSLDDLINIQGNLKRLDEPQYKKLRNLILEVGFSSPFYVYRDKKKLKLLDGVQRLQTLKMMRADKIAMPEKFPAVVVKAKDEQTAKKILLGLASVFGRLSDESLSDFAIDAGISLDFINGNLDLPFISGLDQLNAGSEPTAGLTDPDAAPEPPKKTKIKVGDVYLLEQHRLICGDSTSKDVIDELLDGEIPDMVFTDPPYGMSAVTKSGVLSAKYKTDIMNDDSVDVAKNSYTLAAMLGIPKMVFWGANYYASALPDAPAWLVWDKNNGGSDQMDAELAWTNLKGVTRQFTKASEKTNRVHPTQKPVELATWCFDRYDAGDVLDMFGGSGSTLIACEQTNRKCFVSELDPIYCEVIIERWQNFTGKEAARLDPGGELTPWSEI